MANLKHIALADIICLRYIFDVKSVAYTFSARKSLRKLPADVQAKINAKLDRYSATGAGDVTALKGSDGARMRVDDYRVIFVETDAVIEVRAVGHRREVYR